MSHNDLIITALDRFVWFILLIIVSHLGAEITKRNDYTKEACSTIIPANESVLVNPNEMPRLTIFPNHVIGTINESKNDASSKTPPTF